VEAAAKYRQLKINQRNKYRDMLDYLVTVSSAKDAELTQQVTRRTRESIEKSLATDSTLQQKLIDGAIHALETGEKDDTGLPALFESAFVSSCDAVDAEASASRGFDKQSTAVFNKRFDLETTVTEDMMKAAAADPSEYAILVGKIGGGTPEVGKPIKARSPLHFTH